MRFLSKGPSEERGEKILEAVIKMAKSLDMLVIAEGVEEEKQVKMVYQFTVLLQNSKTYQHLQKFYLQVSK